MSLCLHVIGPTPVKIAFFRLPRGIFSDILSSLCPSKQEEIFFALLGFYFHNNSS